MEFQVYLKKDVSIEDVLKKDNPGYQNIAKPKDW
jgi:hypothetical protein